MCLSLIIQHTHTHTYGENIKKYLKKHPLFRKKKKEKNTVKKECNLRYLIYVEQQIPPSISFFNICHNAVTTLGKEKKVFLVKSDVKDAVFSIF